MDGEEVVVKPSPMASLASKSQIVPFWLEECPHKHKARWGNRWAKIRQVLLELPEVINKTEVDKFDFKLNGLEDVLEVARKNKWDAFADKFVITLLFISELN